MAAKIRECRECGEAFTQRRRQAEFCCTGCRGRFNNRRMLRGAEIYDLWMANRFQRSEAADADVWSFMCRLSQWWRAQDERERSSRRSWGSLKEVKSRHAHLNATVVERNYRAGR